RQFVGYLCIRRAQQRKWHRALHSRRRILCLMPFTDAEKADLRRFCGYPAYGTAAVNMQSWRFFQVYGLLEFRMNNLSDAEAAIVRRYLGTLTVLELAIPRSGENLDTDEASVWTRNRDELRDRTRLFDDWRRHLCGFFGVPPGPAMAENGIALVV